MQEKAFYQPESHLSTRTLEEWADYISSSHYYCCPNVYQHCGEVVSFVSIPCMRGFYLELTNSDLSGQRACVSTRYMSTEKYMAIERYARIALDTNSKIIIEGELGYDSFGLQITQVERVWLSDNSTQVFRLKKNEDIHG